MYPMKKLVLATAAASMLGLSSLAVHASETTLSTQAAEVTEEGKVWSVLALDRHLHPFGIDVDVKSGTATLTGSVESDLDRDLAGQLALVTKGVHTVDNQLTVNPPAADQQGKARLSQQVDDVTLTALIKSKLLWNTNTEGLEIHVTTKQGVVTLKGTANSAEAKTLAGQLAANTNGVLAVDNQLKVSGTPSSSAASAITDTWVTSKVKSSLLYESNLDGLDISVETLRGMVRLSGSVLSAEAKQFAISTARNIRGVRGVDAGALRIDS